MNKSKREKLLQKLKEGILSKEEEKELWRIKGIGQIDPFDDGEPVLENYNNLEGPFGMEESLSRIVRYQANRVGRKKKFYRMYLSVASVAAVFLMYAGFILFREKLMPNATPEFVLMEVPNGSIKRLVLPDSSVATLSSGTVLRYPKSFAKNERAIYLDQGEAFFEVIKNPNKRFRVQSGELQTIALGTSFTVQYDPKLKREKVKLYSGKVSVESVRKINEDTKEGAVILTPGKAYEYLEGEVVLSDFDNNRENPISQGLHFEDVPFEEAIYRISSWYGISLTFDRNNIKSDHINGNFNNKKLEDIFYILTHTQNLQIKKTDSLTYEIMMSRK
ncbi:FecR family protein [Sphingobacterium sp. HJSM2_6]|uniref:FecR family protein n=1 Tax=Sphingobacterium sp. HJSM2_6 TaxID=3366264 RepID=UPI003BC02631